MPFPLIAIGCPASCFEFCIFQTAEVENKEKSPSSAWKNQSSSELAFLTNLAHYLGL